MPLLIRGQAIKFLQRAVGVQDDGKVGPATLGAIRDRDPMTVIAMFNAERLAFMTGLGTWSSFGRGWARRVAENIRYAVRDIAGEGV